MPAEWYETFWQRIDPARVEEIKLTGGEPFLYRKIGKVVEIIRQVSSRVPIRIFTGGRNIVSLKSGKEDIKETVRKILETSVIFESVKIHISREDILRMNQLGIPLLQTQVKNFLAACEILVANNKGFGGGRIKIHTEIGRLNYHRQEIFPWFDGAVWESKVISSEGLIRSGSAEEIDSAIELLSTSQLSSFLLPGAEFYQKPQTRKAQKYQNPESQSVVYFDVARVGGCGASIIGWWNIVNRVFCGGSTYDTYRLIGKTS